MNTSNKDQNIVALVYGAIWAALIIICVPSVTFSIVASVLFILLLITAYILRKKSAENDFINNHMSYIIKTLWFSVFILPAITLTAAIIYMMPNIDNSAIMPCAQPLAEHLLENPDDAGMQTLYGYLLPCINNFIIGNKTVFFIATLIAALPIFTYMIYRLGKGTILVLQSKIHTNPKSWLK